MEYEVGKQFEAIHAKLDFIMEKLGLLEEEEKKVEKKVVVKK